MAEKKYTRVREHIRRLPSKKTASKESISPIRRVVEAEADAIIKGRRRKIS